MLSGKDQDEITSIILNEKILTKSRWIFERVSKYYSTDILPYYFFESSDSAGIKFDLYNMISSVYRIRSPKDFETFGQKPDYWYHTFDWREAYIGCSQGRVTIRIRVDVLQKWIDKLEINLDFSELESFEKWQSKCITEAATKIAYLDPLKLLQAKVKS